MRAIARSKVYRVLLFEDGLDVSRTAQVRYCGSLRQVRLAQRNWRAQGARHVAPEDAFQTAPAPRTKDGWVELLNRWESGREEEQS